MGEVTKRQHYVWRKYLRAWSTSNDLIYSLIIINNKVVRVNLMGAAQSNYFYRMRELPSEQIDFIRNYISIIPNVLQGLALDLLDCYKSFSELSFQYRTNPTSMAHITNIDAQLRDIEIQTFEKIHGTIVLFGNDLIECKTIDSLESIVNDDLKFNRVMVFLCIQYSRTNAMKVRFEDSMKERPTVYSVVENAWPLLSLISGFHICHSLIQNNPSFYFVENPTAIPFITGDQPLINSVGDDVDLDGFAKDLVFYYPISPKSAIIIKFTKTLGVRFIQCMPMKSS